MLARAITLTATATSLATALGITEDYCKSVILQAPEANVGNVLFGDDACQPMFIKPGGAATVSVDRLKNLYVRGTANDVLNVCATDSDE